MPTEPSHLQDIDLRDLVHVLQRAHILCLPCIASALTIESSEAEVLMRTERGATEAERSGARAQVSLSAWFLCDGKGVA